MNFKKIRLYILYLYFSLDKPLFIGPGKLFHPVFCPQRQATGTDFFLKDQLQWSFSA